MTDGQSQTPKEPSKGFIKAPKIWLKKAFSRPHSGSTIIGTSAAVSQQGIFHASLSPGKKALSPACRSSHSGPLIKIPAILLKFRPTCICSGSWFETLKVYGIVKLISVHRSAQHPNSGWPCLGQSYSTSWYEYSTFIAQSG